MIAENEKPTERALSFAWLPDRLDGWRVLEVGDGGSGADYLRGIGAADFVTLEEPSEEPGPEAAGFDLVVCSSDLETELHPLAVYAWLRRMIKPEGVLVVGSAVISDPTRSQYARFLTAEEGGGRSRWLPGRLAFRWMVEVSGFDVVGWLGGGDPAFDEGPAYLQAQPAERLPALDLDRQPLGR